MNELKPEDILKHKKIVVGLQSEEPAPCYRLPVKWKPEDMVRALECCADKLLTCHSKNCPLINEWNCREILAKNVLAILSEKDAEIEKLETAFEKEYVRVEHLMRQLETARAEAITEFAEKAKRRLPIVSPSVFDKIAQEMKGEIKND